MKNKIKIIIPVIIISGFLLDVVTKYLIVDTFTSIPEKIKQVEFDNKLINRVTEKEEKTLLTHFKLDKEKKEYVLKEINKSHKLELYNIFDKYHFFYNRHTEVIGSFIVFRLVYNKGLSFGMFSSNPSLGLYIVFSVVSFFALCFVVYLMRKVRADNYPVKMAFSLILVGAFGNIIFDRFFGSIYETIALGKPFVFFHRKVVDFIDMGFGDTRWPSYNVADIAITAGVAWLLILAIFMKNEIIPDFKKVKKDKKENEEISD